ncbi:MAG: 2-isopropylmalate synthase [Candidatus Saganbacteria bacterium]|nr:2-isopropylmalate synthase [Candidatus Saganbacteria bacterium]
MTKKILIFDTTLRDGEQAPGCSLNTEEKLEIAKQLAKLNVDAIEAGFAISSPGDFEAVAAIAKNIKGPVIASLARAKKEDIKAAYDAIKAAKRHRIHIFLATSPIHMEKKLRMSPEEVLATSASMVKYARTLCDDVEFSCEDAGRSEPAFLYKVIEAVIDAGASTINLPDTVGYKIPAEFGKMFAEVRKNVPNIDKIILSTHCHNDLGLAVANSIAAIENGVTQIECTINGLGERAGNASLEEVVMAIKTRKDFLDAETSINTKEIYRTSRLVSNLTGMIVQANKAVVGANAFAHEAGIHQAGVMRARETYEIMDPAELGIGESKLVLGKHSGRNAFIKKLKELGFDLKDEETEKAFNAFKVLSDKKKEISDKDIESLISDEIYVTPETYKLEFLKVSSGTKLKPTAEVSLMYKGKACKVKGFGDGPVDAVYKVIDKIVKRPVKLVDYIIQAITGGTDAMGEVMVRIKEKEQIFSGHGSDTDIIIASAKAYINAINKMVNEK